MLALHEKHSWPPGPLWRGSFSISQKGSSFSIIVCLTKVLAASSHLLLPKEQLKKKYFSNGGIRQKWDTYEEINKLTVAEFLERVNPNFEQIYLKSNITTLHYVGRKK